MHFSTSYAFLFGLAGFAAAAYHLNVGMKVKWIPLIGLVLCVLYTLDNYGASYAFLTGIEYAVGFGLAHAFYGKSKSESDDQIS
jgi:hypothetical protein